MNIRGYAPRHASSAGNLQHWFPLGRREQGELCAMYSLVTMFHIIQGLNAVPFLRVSIMKYLVGTKYYSRSYGDRMSEQDPCLPLPRNLTEKQGKWSAQDKIKTLCHSSPEYLAPRPSHLADLRVTAFTLSSHQPRCIPCALPIYDQSDSQVNSVY